MVAWSGLWGKLWYGGSGWLDQFQLVLYFLFFFDIRVHHRLFIACRLVCGLARLVRRAPPLVSSIDAHHIPFGLRGTKEFSPLLSPFHLHALHISIEGRLFSEITTAIPETYSMD